MLECIIISIEAGILIAVKQAVVEIFIDESRE